VARAAGYLAIALALGGMLFVALAWSPALAGTGLSAAAAPFARRARRLIAGAAVLGAGATASGLVLEGATGAGTSVWSALDTTVLRDVVHTHFGTMWTLRLGAWALLGAGLAVTALRRAPVPVAVHAGRCARRWPSPAAARARGFTAPRLPAPARAGRSGAGRSP
jgi:hypothetical protein